MFEKYRQEPPDQTFRPQDGGLVDPDRSADAAEEAPRKGLVRDEDGRTLRGDEWKHRVTTMRDRAGILASGKWHRLDVDAPGAPIAVTQPTSTPSALLEEAGQRRRRPGA